MQLNGRVAMERLNFIFRHAGFGCKDSFATGGSMDGEEPDGSTVSIDSVLWDIQNTTANGTNSDSVVVAYGFRRVAKDTVISGSDVNCNRTNGPTITNNGDANDVDDFKNYLAFVPDTGGNRFYQVQTVSLTGKNYVINLFQSNEELESGADVYMVVPVRIMVVNNLLSFKNFAYKSSNLWEIAEHIQSLQLQYTTDGSTWEDNPADLEDVIGVSFFVLTRTQRPDPDYTDTKSYTMAGQTVGPFQDSFHRKLFQGTVWLRN